MAESRQNMGRKKPQILAQRSLFQSRLFRVEQLQLRFSNGAERTYERLNPGTHRAVMIVAMLDPEHVLLVREYGAGIGDYYLSLPKGAIHDGEDMLATADRELKEEAGYGARRLRFVRELYLSPSYLGNHISIVLAEDLYPERQVGDEPEPLEVVPFPLAEMDRLLAMAEFREAYAVAALYMVRDFLQRGEG